ncbi:hypothetical protein BOO24_16360 [Vibrio navarrensis]|nr:hypothetical protein [Vibrio navarrensis]
MSVFDPGNVQLIGIVQEMHTVSECYFTKDKRNLACLSNVVNGEVNIKDLLFKGELTPKYINR